VRPPASRHREASAIARDTPATVYLDPDEIERVVSLSDPVARNVAITHGYHELADAVAGLLGHDNANWLCYGQWASAEAGRAIRRETIPLLLRPFIGDEVAEAVAGGNAAVFGDVGPTFVRFVVAFEAEPEAVHDRERAMRILDRLLAHPQLAASEDLQRAFRAYTDAMLLRGDPAPDAAVRRAQRMLAANTSIGAHEQVVADPFVRAAIPGSSLIAVAATAHLGIHIPDGALELDADVPAPTYLDGAAFPAALADLHDPDVLELAARFGQDLTSAIHSDAPNWEDYRERMGYIFTFLRAYQQDPRMFELPPDAAG
jgi:hypothetical protein